MLPGSLRLEQACTVLAMRAMLYGPCPITAVSHAMLCHDDLLPIRIACHDPAVLTLYLCSMTLLATVHGHTAMLYHIHVHTVVRSHAIHHSHALCHAGYAIRPLGSWVGSPLSLLRTNGVTDTVLRVVCYTGLRLSVQGYYMQQCSIHSIACSMTVRSSSLPVAIRH